ncbi:MAG: hypothetical protein RI556_12920 [Hydrogenovibrio sp.]|uniref:hypothetical protein n=1 Tax=Hydrogenovibrio sp. TaxID=2065821 RepID=UPI0028702F38|nr:hypothetical protein [Hydrogenovibrio sp.]MDR9500072.1 hypothetical protein [Hydrogenovibrio sp.]
MNKDKSDAEINKFHKTFLTAKRPRVMPPYDTNIITDRETGEVIGQSKQYRPPAQPPRPPVDPAYLKGKSGRQLEVILNAIYPQPQYAPPIRFEINKLGTKFCVFQNEVVFLEDKTFKDKLKAFAITQLGLTDLSDTAIKNVISVIKTSNLYWHVDDRFSNSPSVRVINLGYPHIYYALNPNHFIPLNMQSQFDRPISGLLTPPQAEWAPYTEPNLFAYHEIQNSIQQKRLNPVNTFALLEVLGIQKHHHYIVLTWLIYNLTANDFIALEICSENEKLREFASDALKRIIDPTKQTTHKIPKKTIDIANLGRVDYLVALETTEKLSKTQQEGIFDLMTGNGVVVDGLKPRPDKAQFQVKRPILISAPDTSITEPKLRERSLSIEMEFDKHQSSSNYIITNSDANTINQARIEVLRLSIATGHIIHSNYERTFHGILKKNEHLIMDKLINLGMDLCLLTSQYKNKFTEQFRKTSEENLFMEMDDSDTAYLIYVWAKDKENNEEEHSETHPIKDWKKILSKYAENEGISWDSIETRKIGADFKKAKPTLAKFGIILNSDIRSKRLSQWSITIPKKIDIFNGLYTTTEEMIRDLNSEKEQSHERH